MKAWMKGAIFGFVSGFIYWAYVMITKLHLYESEKYDIAFYSFFYGVVLVGVLSGVLFYIWSNVDWRIIIAGSIWGLFSILGFMFMTGMCSISACQYKSNDSILYYLVSNLYYLLFFPMTISFTFFQILGERHIPGSIGIITLILLLSVTGPLSLILFKNIYFSIINGLLRLIGKVKNKKGVFLLIGMGVMLTFQPVSADSSNITVNVVDDETADVTFDMQIQVNSQAGFEEMSNLFHSTYEQGFKEGVKYIFNSNITNYELRTDPSKYSFHFELTLGGDYSDNFTIKKIPLHYEEYLPVSIDEINILKNSNMIANIANYAHSINYSIPLNEGEVKEKDLLPAGSSILAEAGSLLPIFSGPSKKGSNPNSNFTIPGYWVGWGSDTVPNTGGYSALAIAEMYKPYFVRNCAWYTELEIICLPINPYKYPTSVNYRVFKGYDPYTATANDQIAILYSVFFCGQTTPPHCNDWEPIVIFVNSVGEDPYKVIYDRWRVEGFHQFHIERNRTGPGATWIDKENTFYGNTKLEDFYTQDAGYFPLGKTKYNDQDNFIGDNYAEVFLNDIIRPFDNRHLWVRVGTLYNTFDPIITKNDGTDYTDYTLSPLDDEKIKSWCTDYECCSILPIQFTQDISDPFHGLSVEGSGFSFPQLSLVITDDYATNTELTVDVSVKYYTEGWKEMRGLRKESFKASSSTPSYSAKPTSIIETDPGEYTLVFDVSSISRRKDWYYSVNVDDNLLERNAIGYDRVDVPSDTQGPDPPVLTYPSPGETIRDPRPTFQWNEPTDPGGSDIDHYHIWVADNIDFRSPIFDDDAPSTSYTAPSALNGDTYYWTVGAVDGAGNIGSNSSPNSFTVDTSCVDTGPPTIPTSITVPSDSDTGEFTVLWDSSSDECGISHYELREQGPSRTRYVDADSTSKEIVVSENGGYTYDVRAWDIDNNPSTGWSSPSGSINVNIPAPPPPLAKLPTWSSVDDFTDESGVAGYAGDSWGDWTYFEGGDYGGNKVEKLSSFEGLSDVGKFHWATVSGDARQSIEKTGSWDFSFPTDSPVIIKIYDGSNSSLPDQAIYLKFWDSAGEHCYFTGETVNNLNTWEVFEFYPNADCYEDTGIDWADVTKVQILAESTHDNVNRDVYFDDLGWDMNVYMRSNNRYVVNPGDPFILYLYAINKFSDTLQMFFKINGGSTPNSPFNDPVQGDTYHDTLPFTASSTPGTYTYIGTVDYNLASGQEMIDSNPVEIIVKDNIPPKVTIITPQEGNALYTYVYVNWSGSDVDSGMDHYKVKLDANSWEPKGLVTEHTFAGVAEGLHTVHVKAVDGAGNSATNSTGFLVDATAPLAPIAQIATPDTWTSTNSFSVNWTNPDDPSGISGAFYKNDTPPTFITDGIWTASKPISGFSVSDDGSHPFYVWLNDSVGNVDHNNHEVIMLNYDGTPPSAPSGTIWDDGPYSKDTEIVANWGDATDTSGIIDYYLQVDNSTDFSSGMIFNGWVGSSISSKTLTSADGVADGDTYYYYRVEAKNGAGLTSGWSTELAGVLVDTTPPNTTITSGPIDPSNLSSATFVFGSTEPASTFECLLDDGVFLSCTTPYAYADLAEGIHIFHVRAIDPAVNVDLTPASHSWSVDTTPPTVENSNATQIVEGQDEIVRVDIWDASGVDTVLLEVDGTENYTLINKTGNTYNYTISNPAMGTHRIRYFVNDTLGNMNDTVADTFIVSDAETTFQIRLYPDMNLVSFPTVPENLSFSRVIIQTCSNYNITQVYKRNNQDGSYTVIDYYNTTNCPNGVWYDPEIWPDAPVFESGNSYWLNSDKEFDLGITGVCPSTTQNLTLSLSMNLVGWSSCNMKNVSDSIIQTCSNYNITQVYKRNNQDGSYTVIDYYNTTNCPNGVWYDPEIWPDAPVFEPGLGYWFNSLEDLLWEYEP